MTRALEALEIVGLVREHLAAVEAIEAVSFSTPWPEASIGAELHRTGALCLTALSDGRVVGYLVSWVVGGELHVAKVAVDPSRRRLGIGRALCLRAIEAARARGATVALLEVRASNAAAAALYARLGFGEVGLRRAYYADGAGGEDALLLARDLSTETPPE